MVELVDNFKRLSDLVAGLERSTKLDIKFASDMVNEVSWQAWRGLADICAREHRLQQLEDWADTVAGDGGSEADTSNSWKIKMSGAWHPLTLSWMPCGGVVLVWWHPFST